MPYSTIDRFFQRYPRLGITNVSSSIMETWIEAASNYIDGYIGSIVATIPVTPSPPLLMDLCEDIAHVMFLRRHTPEAGKGGGIDRMWSEAINRLENLRAGTMLLYSGSGTLLSLTQRNEPPWSSVSQYTPTFGLSDIEDSLVDPDRKDDEEDAR